MDFNSLSVQNLASFLRGRRVTGSELCFPEEAVQNLFDNGIDGANLLFLIDDLAELKAIVPNTIHRLQLRRIVKFAQTAPENELPGISSELVNEHPGLAMFGKTSNVIVDEEDKENFNMTSYMQNTSLTPPTYHVRSPISPWYQPPPGRIEPNNVLSPQTQDQCNLPSTMIPAHEHGNADYIHVPQPPQYLCQEKQGPSFNSPDPVTPPVSGKRPADNDLEGLPQNVPLPDQYSIKVEEAIVRNDISSVRLQIIKDIGNFFYGMCRHPRKGDYMKMAKKVCERFPELRDINSERYWESVQHQLSMYFRNQRRCSVPNSKTKTAANKAEKMSKKVKFGDDAVGKKRNVELLKNSKEENFSKHTYEKLIEETFSCRRSFVKHEAKSTSDILTSFPFLRNPEHLLHELKRIIGTEKAEKAKENLEMALKAVVTGSKSDLSDQDVVAGVTTIEKRTKRKGQTKFITFHDPSTPPEKLFKSKIVEFRIVCVGTPEATTQIFISGEGDAIFQCPTNSILDSLIYVIACYYVFDVSYPVCFQGILCFVQDLGLCCLDNCYRGSKYNVLVSEVKRTMQ